MMTTAHTHYNYNRRNSTSLTPYTIPTRAHNAYAYGHVHAPTPPQVSAPVAGPNGPHAMSQSVPSLSRAFVVRRILEGETGRLKEELKCEACGKGYKHISSLAKHLWEHTPEWNVTKKLLISKHQQVQLLEAASILVGMNDQGQTDAVFDDDKNLPFSPRSSDTTPPADDRRPQFKSSFGSAATDENVHSYPYSRSHSILQHPPIDENKVYRSPSISGGYLDVGRAKSRSNSVAVSYDGLKSPPSSYKQHHGFRKPSIVASSSPRAAPMPKDDFDDEDEGVLGKME